MNKHVSFDELQLPFTIKSKRDPTLRVQHEHATNEKDETKKEMIFLHSSVDGEANSGENLYVGDNNSEEGDHEKEALQEIPLKPLRRSTGTRKETSWFEIDAMPRTFTENERL